MIQKPRKVWVWISDRPKITIRDNIGNSLVIADETLNGLTREEIVNRAKKVAEAIGVETVEETISKTYEV